MDPLAAYKDGRFHHLKPRNSPDSHEFSGDGEYIERCRSCNGYPFDLQHWTI
jgi:hypothetical protein